MTKKLEMAILLRYDFLFHINCFLVAFAMTPKNQGIAMTILAPNLNTTFENVKNGKLI